MTPDDIKKARALVEVLEPEVVKIRGQWIDVEEIFTAALDEIERLQGDNDLCQKCGHPRNNHPYRHPFVSMKGSNDD